MQSTYPELDTAEYFTRQESAFNCEVFKRPHVLAARRVLFLYFSLHFGWFSHKRWKSLQTFMVMPSRVNSLYIISIFNRNFSGNWDLFSSSSWHNKVESLLLLHNPKFRVCHWQLQMLRKQVWESHHKRCILVAFCPVSSLQYAGSVHYL